MIVVDTSVLVAVVTGEATTPRLIEATRGAELVAPYSVHWEMGNAFSAMLKRGRATLAEVEGALAAYESIPIRFIDVDLVEAVRIADAAGIYAYDAYVLACAKRIGSPVLTLDQGLVAAAAGMGVDVVEVAQ